MCAEPECFQLHSRNDVYPTRTIREVVSRYHTNDRKEANWVEFEMRRKVASKQTHAGGILEKVVIFHECCAC